MTPRQRVIAALRGEPTNKVPLTAYADQVPRSQTCRRLRNGGLCLIDRQASVHRTVTPHVASEQVHYREGDRDLVRTVLRTEAGELSCVEQLGPGRTRWHVERLFKGPEDYARLRAVAADELHLPEYAAYERLEAERGEDFLLKPEIGYSPLHDIMYRIMGIDTFAGEWSERRDEVLSLYETIAASRRRLYPVIAASPALMTTYCGNLDPGVIGLSRFESYYRPHLDEFAALMHEHGKLAGTQFDGGTWLFEEAIGLAQLDCVEHFTPAPDGDLAVAQARTVWHDKALWVTFPPTALHGSVDQVRETALQLLREAASGVRFLLGVTEGLPADRWQPNLLAMMHTINDAGPLPLT
jgi:hypothetical protein